MKKEKKKKTIQFFTKQEIIQLWAVIHQCAIYHLFWTVGYGWALSILKNGNLKMNFMKIRTNERKNRQKVTFFEAIHVCPSIWKPFSIIFQSFFFLFFFIRPKANGQQFIWFNSNLWVATLKLFMKSEWMAVGRGSKKKYVKNTRRAENRDRKKWETKSTNAVDTFYIVALFKRKDRKWKKKQRWKSITPDTLLCSR